MADTLEKRIVDIIQSTLRDKNNHPNLTISSDDSMETIECWDSLAFMSVFLAVNDEFGIEPDFDDAIHYTSVQTLTAYLSEHAAS
jgi:acyl carrier protein